MQYRRQLAAGILQTLEAVGNAVYLVSAAGAVVVEVTGRKAGNRRESLLAGQGIVLRDGEQFEQVRITSATNQEIYISVASDEFVDKRVVGAVQSTAVRKTALEGYAADVLADTDVVVLTIDGDVLITNKAGSAGTLWVSEAGAVNYGHPIAPGSSLPVNDFTGTIEVYSEGANTLCVVAVV